MRCARLYHTCLLQPTLLLCKNWVVWKYRSCLDFEWSMKLEGGDKGGWVLHIRRVVVV